MKYEKQPLSRRILLGKAASAGATMLLAACGERRVPIVYPTSTPAPGETAPTTQPTVARGTIEARANTAVPTVQDASATIARPTIPATVGPTAETRVPSQVATV